jgi:tetratricopeptide (TPR) repeat protein
MRDRDLVDEWMKTMPFEPAPADIGHEVTFAQGSVAPRDDVGTEATMATDSAGLAPRVARGSTPPREDYTELTTVDPTHYVFDGELARGGMGRILRARDRRVGRTVAIKELLGADHELRARFEREARITARLQHPSIVNLLEAGRWPDGEPFYAMKLVAGRSLAAEIEARATLTERMGLLPSVIAVTEALAYAHQQRVIHRDLKPDNVLVGDHGETVVIDWGIAKDLCESDLAARASARGVLDENATVDGAIMGTPRYMAPEQANGEPADERSDVWALGAILYHVLAGAPPYPEPTVAAILVAVTEGPPVRIDRRVKGVPPELVTIVTKALAHDPAQRYANAGELAADLRKFQTGQLVGTHQYTLVQRLARWVRKHRIAVTVAAVATVVLAAISIASVTRILDEQRQAEAARVVAEKHRAESDELFTFVLLDMNNTLKKIGKLDLMSATLGKAKALYEQRNNDDPLQRAKLHLEIASNMEQSGATRAAQADLRTGLTFAWTAFMLAPSDAAREVLVGGYKDLGDMRLARGKSAEAEAWFRTALAFAPREPRSATLDAEVANVWQNLAAAQGMQGDLRAANDSFAESVRIWEQVYTHDPDDSNESGLVLAYNGLAIGLYGVGRVEDSIATLRKALAISERRHAAAPEDMVRLSDLAVMRANLAEALHEQGELAEALAEVRAAGQHAERLVEREPESVEYLDTQIQAILRAGELELERGDTDSGVATLRRAVTMAEQLVAKEADNMHWRTNVMRAHCGLAEATGGADALAHARTCEQLARDFVRETPDVIEVHALLARARARLAQLALSAGDHARAKSGALASVDIANQVLGADPANVVAKRALLDGRITLGAASLALSDQRAAIASYHAARELVDVLKQEAPARALWVARHAEIERALSSIE